MNTGFLGPAVATVLTACGIETMNILSPSKSEPAWLQQYLPLAVLKLANNLALVIGILLLLQQYLPLAVLKPYRAL